MTSPGDFLNQETALGLLAGFVVGLLAYFAASKLLGATRSTKGKSAVERQFRNVFSIVDDGRRQALIRYYMEKYECGCAEAMRRAVDERQHDANRW
ncbi:hypothetical protein I6F26_26320 [Ensifer sp. IC3342]|nr:hypothetical protein [Ensifer sp. BRP08]MCA1450076.1 hypothetical protein [Ensifer sp. IC3342]